MSARLRVIIHGRVQGVGFRYSTAAKAQSLGLTGFVRNLVTGSVEALFEGARETLDEMLAWCEEGPPLARVERIEETWTSGAPEYKRFELTVGG